ncbi:DUF4031 domain-containing protein [Ornithinimicrobium sp. Y1694]|uniref:DUF4031 domain-containing protein n=1 Tax=Ornithinimicrobium sp. Y1694 TaxID=3418590 RepID=UPI003CEDC0A5
MTVYIDPPLWPAHGRRFSHLISDRSLAELHTVAARAGLDPRAFEGDHYDVPEDLYAASVAAGAQPIGATALARVLRDSPLRFRKRRGERPLGRVANGLSAAFDVEHTLDLLASPFDRTEGGAAVVLIRAADARMVLVRNASRPGWGPPGGKREPGETLREAATREVAEETGLALAPDALVPVGYERITVPDGINPAPLDTGDNFLQVYGAAVDQPSPLRPDLDDVLEAAWFSRAEAAAQGEHQSWWPLVRWWWERH